MVPGTLGDSGFYRGKRVLVAGGTGTIGIPVCHQLVARGADVRIASLDSEQYAKRVLPPEAVFSRVDLTDLDACERATGDCDYVINLVGIKGSVGIGETKVASYLVPMLWFQTNLMEACFRNRVTRFLFVGSICSYPRSDEPKVEETVWDGLPKQNDRIPGVAKRIGELQAEAYLLEHGWDAVRIVRPSNVYGPFDDFVPGTAQVIPALIHRMLNGENPIRVWGDGSARRDFVFSEDLAFWMLESLEHAPPCLPLNLGSGIPASIRTVAETIAECLPLPPRIEWDPAMPAGDPVRVLSIARAADLIGYTPRVSLTDGIRRTVDWLRANGELAYSRG